jgi:hypothetical protein
MHLIKSGRIRRAAALTAVGLAVLTCSGAALAIPANAAAQPTSYTVSAPWTYDWNGGCGAKATATYYPATDTAVINSTAMSPYLFAGCRLRTHLQVEVAGALFEGADQYVTACAVLDPGCASTRSTGNQTFTGQTPTFTAFVESLNAQLESLGLRKTTRQAVARGISISFSKAG